MKITRQNQLSKKEKDNLYYLTIYVMRIPLEPLFRKLWILEATTPEEIDVIVKSLRESEDCGINTDGFKTLPVSKEMAEWFDKLNRVVAGELDYNEAFPNE